MLTTKTKVIILAVVLFLIVGGFAATVIHILITPNVVLTLDRQLLDLEVGKTGVLTAKDIDPDKLEWSSSDASVAQVDQAGKVKALSPGSAVITVKTGQQIAACNVFVSLALQITPDSLWVTIWETKQVQISGNDDEWIMWTSDNNEIAEVDGQGNVTGKAVGTTKIKAENNGKTAQCDVTVYGVSPGSISLQAGESQQVQLTPVADGEAVTWVSRDTNIATVDQSGNITAVAIGRTEVTASAEGKQAVCTVKVKPQQSAVGISKVSELACGWEWEPPHISPDGSMCVKRDATIGRVWANLVDKEGNTISLPGSGAGQPTWCGTKVVWHNVEREYNDGTEEFSVVKNTVYIYETLEHTYTEITVDMPDAPTLRCLPVLSSDGTVYVVFPNGLWTYSLAEESWTHAAAFQAEAEENTDWPELIWSPDLKKVVWHEADEELDKFMLLNIASGNVTTIHQQPILGMYDAVSKLQPILHMAWSSDSKKIAISGGTEENILILSTSGEVLNSIVTNDYISSLTWVPGQKKVAYATINELNIADTGTGNQWLVNIPVFRHTWLPNGNLVVLDEEEGAAIYKIDWED